MMPEQKKILIIDDDPEFTSSVVQVLKHEGYALFSSSNGKDGLLLAGRIKPDLIILDVMMDYNSEGFDVSRELRRHGALSGTPVVLVTGIHREMNLPFKFEIDNEMLPVDAILEKPVAPVVLIKTIKNIFGEMPEEAVMNKKALVIDDNPEFARSVLGILAIKGYDVVTAENGTMGVQKAVVEKPDVIFMDVMMEDCADGLVAVKKLRDTAGTKDIPVFLITGVKKPEYLLGSFAPGEEFPNVREVFEKPVPPDMLIGALENVA